MITKLTKSQEEQLEVYKNKWIAIGLSVNRINEEEAKKKLIIPPVQNSHEADDMPKG